MDKLFIHDLKIETVLGAYNWEKKLPQIITLDLEYSVDTHKAALTDHLEETCNYIEVGQAVINYIQNSQFQLVETLAEKTAEMLKQKFNISWLKLRIRKMGTLSTAKEVGIEIER